MADIEWVQIPALKNYEINKDGEVRDIQSKKLQSWGKQYFLYGKNSVGRRSMFAIMRATFGDDSVDNSNAVRVE